MEKGNQWTKISWNRGISSSSHFELFCKYVFFFKLHKTYRKIPVLESLSNKAYSCYVKTTIFSKACLLKLSNRETGAASLCLFWSLYCWVWMHTCSNSVVRMYWIIEWVFVSVPVSLVLNLSKYVRIYVYLLCINWC